MKSFSFRGGNVLKFKDEEELYQLLREAGNIARAIQEDDLEAPYVYGFFDTDKAELSINEAQELMDRIEEGEIPEKKIDPDSFIENGG